MHGIHELAPENDCRESCLEGWLWQGYVSSIPRDLHTALLHDKSNANSRKPSLGNSCSALGWPVASWTCKVWTEYVDQMQSITSLRTLTFLAGASVHETPNLQ